MRVPTCPICHGKPQYQKVTRDTTTASFTRQVEVTCLCEKAVRAIKAHPMLRSVASITLKDPPVYQKTIVFKGPRKDIRIEVLRVITRSEFPDHWWTGTSQDLVNNLMFGDESGNIDQILKFPCAYIECGAVINNKLVAPTLTHVLRERESYALQTFIGIPSEIQFPLSSDYSDETAAFIKRTPTCSFGPITSTKQKLERFQ